MAVEYVEPPQIPQPPFIQEVNMETDEQMLQLADFALDLLNAMRDMKENPSEMPEADLQIILRQMWDVVDDITNQLMQFYLKPPPKEGLSQN